MVTESLFVLQIPPATAVLGITDNGASSAHGSEPSGDRHGRTGAGNSISWLFNMSDPTEIHLPSSKPRGMAVARQQDSASILTKQQREVLDLCVESGELFYSQGIQCPGPIRPRLFPLLCAPTGSGKSMLVARCAERLGAYYRRSQRGDLAPQGAARMRASLFQILDLLVLHERVLWHIDELCKFSVEGGGATAPANDWAASIFSDLWSALDGVFPIDSYLAIEDRPRGKDPAVNLQYLEKRVRNGLFIVGSGTWQDLFSRASKPSVGFAIGTNDSPQAVTAADVRKSQLISPELLARFNANLIILGYPDRNEITNLLRASGIAKLAKDVGYDILPDDLDFRKGGYRVLETLLSRLLLLQYRRRRANLAKARMNISSGQETENLPFNE